MAFRAFVAVPVGPDPALADLLAELGSTPGGVKVVAPDALHFTLAFLGDIPEDQVAAIDGALQEAVVGVAPFTTQLSSVGAFPNVRHPKVIWVGVDDPAPWADLAGRVRASIARAGVSGDDKDFRAHLTLARVRAESDRRGAPPSHGRDARGPEEIVRFLQRHGQHAFGTMTVDHLSLYRSSPGTRGRTYDALATARLEG